MPSQAKLRAMSLRSETGRLVLQPPTELSLYHPWTANTLLERWEGKQEKGKKKKWPPRIHKCNRLQAESGIF